MSLLELGKTISKILCVLFSFTHLLQFSDKADCTKPSIKASTRFTVVFLFCFVFHVFSSKEDEEISRN